ncbi:MAG TPA: M1 family metallopeptidase, partial [Pricia sp.]|nr:M1 family metallopeptidase [Pricia sp.]
MKLFLFVLPLLTSFFINAQHQDKVDFIRGEILITPLPKEKRILGEVTYTFKVLADVDSVFLDAQNMSFSTVKLNGANAKYSNTDKIISIHKKFKKGRSYKLFLDYAVTPKQTVYFLGWDDGDPENQQTVPSGEQGVPSGRQSERIDSQGLRSGKQSEPSEKQVWTQGQGKYTSYWLPSFDDMEEKVEFDLNITFDASYEVIANGKLVSTKMNSKGKNIWHFDMDHPMSSYLLAFVAGNYKKQELVSKSGIPITNYYYPKDSVRVEPTYRYTQRIFDFLEDEIGLSYPWQNYKQIPVHDFLYAGMENTGTTIFSDGYVIDSTAFVDKNYVNVNAHELAHQWFGNLVTEKDGNHHWLHEGFATYYAYLTE